MNEQKSNTSSLFYASHISATDPESAAKALKGGYVYVFGYSRQIQEPVKVRLYGYRGKDKADIEAEILKLFEEAVFPDGLDVSPDPAKLLSIWKGRKFEGKRVLLIASRSAEWIERAVACIKKAAAEERKAKRQGKPVGAQGVAEGAARRGYTYKTSRALIDNVIAKRDPTFFDKLPAGGEKSYTDERGKPVTLSPYQMKLITAFAQVLDELTARPDIDKSIDFLTFEREEQRVEAGGANGLPRWRESGRGRVSAFIDIPALARLIYSVDNAAGKHVEKVKEEIIKLKRVKQQYRLKQGRKTVTVRVPLIHTGLEAEVEEGGRGTLENRVEIIFEDIFLYELKDKYSLAPVTLLRLWNETGEKSELFAVLLFLLQQERGLKVRQADIITSAARKDLKKGGTAPEEADRQVALIRREALTYRETLASICERLQGRLVYYQKRNGKVYIRKERVEKDLKKATAALIKMGIIAEYYETKNTRLEVVCNFVINDRWLIEEADKIKGLDKTEEEQAENGG